MTSEQRDATALVEAIIADLNNRSGLGLDGIDDETKQEIRSSWITKAQAAIERLTAERDEARAELAKAGDAIRAYESMLDGVAEKAATEACEAVKHEFHRRDVKERIQAARIAELEAAIARLTTPRPIAEAPKDGTGVLAWTASVGWAVLRHLDSYGGWVLASHPTGTYNPTHFLPLPVKP